MAFLATLNQAEPICLSISSLSVPGGTEMDLDVWHTASWVQPVSVVHYNTTYWICSKSAAALTNFFNTYKQYNQWPMAVNGIFRTNNTRGKNELIYSDLHIHIHVFSSRYACNEGLGVARGPIRPVGCPWVLGKHAHFQKHFEYYGYISIFTMPAPHFHILS